jgi:hypothetical protein
MIGKLCTILGVALTWTCATFGIVVFFGPFRFGAGFHEANQRVRRLEMALNQYVLAHGRCPPSRASLIDMGQVDAQSMVDPWGRDIEYSCSEAVVTVASAGPDGAFGTGDDFKNEH